MSTRHRAAVLGVLLSLLLAFAGALAAPAVVRMAGGRAGWVLAALPAGLTLYYLSLLPRLAAGEVMREQIAWVPQLGVSLALQFDGLSALFALMIAGIGTLVLIYAGGYMAGDPGLPRFYLVLLAFMSAMLGVVLADDLIALFVFWELTSLTSYFLIGYKHDYAESRDSALQALLVTGSGALAMLAGFLLIGQIVGSYQISVVVAQAELLQASPYFPAALLLVALGALTKSAQWPFHFWLPNAMAAPTPVSAYLHSATMVKAGVYLLARLSPAFSGTPLWFWLLTLAGGATLIAAASLALLQRDSKRLLAYSTLIALGTLVVLLGVGTPAAIKALVVFLLAHSLYKAPLFMIAGSVDYATGSRDVTRLRGVGRAMPFTWGAALLAGISAAGLPPFFGFLAKELAYEGLFAAPWLLVILIMASAVMLMVVVWVVWRPFAGVPGAAGALAATPKVPREAPLAMLVGPWLLASLGLLFGLVPGVLEGGLMRPAAAAILGQPYVFDLYLWHGFNLALGLSVLTLLLGLGLAALWPRLLPWLQGEFGGLRWGPVAAYHGALRGLVWVAAAQTKLVQPRDLRVQLMTILTFGLLLVGGVALATGALRGVWGWPLGLPGYEALLMLVIAVGVLGTLRASDRVVALTSVGIAGFGIALVFVLFSAPDLAITQFLVETLVVILAALVLIRLPSGSLRTGVARTGKGIAVLVATAFGVLFAGLVLAVVAIPFDGSLTRYFEALSYPGANGRNIVNVILVDFRAIDTLGEIAVLAIAAVGVHALLRRSRAATGAEAERLESPAAGGPPR